MVLTSGLAVWICYGLMKEDWIIVLANTVGASLSRTVLYCKIRDIEVHPQQAERRDRVVAGKLILPRRRDAPLRVLSP